MNLYEFQNLYSSKFKIRLKSVVKYKSTVVVSYFDQNFVFIQHGLNIELLKYKGFTYKRVV